MRTEAPIFLQLLASNRDRIEAEIFSRIGTQEMTLTYFKRYRMEFDLADIVSQPVQLPSGYRFLAWNSGLVQEHAKVKWESFRFEIDANVFPCLGDYDGCSHLMKEISLRKNFIPEATWLIVYQASPTEPMEPCGTIQGLMGDFRLGAIQNVGIVPRHRGYGLGTCLLEQSLQGFRKAGCERVNLEVTVQNTGAIRLYQRIGFRKVETVYKIADVVVAT